MGKPTGFKEIKRQDLEHLPPRERIQHWSEVHYSLSEEVLRQQGARCMDCGVPFCHSGMLLAGMAMGCPIKNLIPEWNDLVYRGLWQEALERLHKTNNFPEFTGRVCPAPCEGSCVLGINEPPVTIKNIECAIIDRGFEEGWVRPQIPKKHTGKKIAVVGSGPAGLAAAAQLNHAGHAVTVFERADRIGGLLMYGIPNPHLDKKVVQRRIDLMEKEGVTFKTKTWVGKDYPAKKLVREFDAVLLAGGATNPRDLKVEGRDFEGIHFAMEFLAANTKTLLDGKECEGYISAKGKDVIVIGGGDTGTDCVATSMRHQAKSVLQLEIMPKPPLERAANNPWPQWPKVYRLDYGQEEAAAIFGADPRQYLTTVKKFTGDTSGNVQSAHLVQMEWIPDGKGRFVPKEIAGSEKVVACDLVLLAMGFLGPEGDVLRELGVDQDSRSNAKADYGDYATNVKGIFSAGDMRRGQSLVVWAIHEGRGAARTIDKYLMGESDLSA
ncbi:MAG: glutamate synthase subunit beta [Candidatus Omnitrophica bacterium]|nr:glutamate synthase subunit beta [Candidatus Omnitrophota bacterium]